MYNSLMGRKRETNKHLPRRLHIKKGWYYYVFRGKWIPLHTQEESLALKRWVQIENSLKGIVENQFNPESSAEKLNSIPFESLVNEYLSEITPNKAKKTQLNERRMAKLLLTAPFANKYVNEITRQEIIRWHHEMRNIPYEANRRLTLLRHMLQYAYDVGYVASNVADEMKRYKETRHKLRLNADILFNKIYPVADPMLKRAIMLAFHLVQHEKEIKNLKWSNFDFKNHIVTFKRFKTGVEITINFSSNSALISYLERLRQDKRELSPYIICHSDRRGWKPYRSFRSMWHRALKKAGYKPGDFKFKEIRHLANTLLKDANIPVEKRMAMTGHRSIKANETYIHNTGKETVEASQALSMYAPKEF